VLGPVPFLLRLRGLAALAVGIGLVVISPSLEAQQAPSAREISESQQRLEQIRQERARLREEMSGLRSRVTDVSSELQNLEAQISTSGELLEEMEFQMEQVQGDIESTTRELLDTRDRVLEMRATLNWRLRDIYKRGPLHEVQVLLSAESFSDLINRYKYLFLMAQRDRNIVNQVREMETELASRERLLRRQRQQVEELRAERQREHQDLETVERERQRTLGTLRSREQTAAQRARQLEEDERSVASLIETLERRRREAERAAEERRRAGRPATPADPAEPTVTTADMGSLDWPVQGRVMYGFGRENQPGGTVVRRNGIGIGADRGTPVRSVEAGTVVHAGAFEGYGPSVFLSHGGGYYSLYLYLDDVRVREGASVTKGQALGGVGGRGPQEAPYMEFQIRAPGGEAVDPLGWLRSRGR